MRRNLIDDLTLELHGANDPFVVTADYDSETDQFTNPSATIQEIYDEMHINKRPCILISSVSELTNRTIIATCYTSRSTSAIFYRLTNGKVYSYTYHNGEIKSDFSTDDVLPLVVTADYVPSSGTISNLSATAQEIVLAAAARPCFLFAKTDLLTTFIAQCDYATFENGSYKAEFSRVTDEGSESWVIDGTTITHYSDFTQGLFTAETGVSISSEKLYRIGKVYVLNLVASGSFSAGKKVLGTYSGIDIDPNGVVGACVVSSGISSGAFNKSASVTLAEDGELSVYSEANYTRVAINLSYILL